jgi:hypothetical protein
MIKVLLAVNGTLMRGLALNKNLRAAGAIFVREAKTASDYQLWSIADKHPAMCRIDRGGAAIALELWKIEQQRLLEVEAKEPPGLYIGEVELEDGEKVLGVLGKAELCRQQSDQTDITEFKGWRNYCRQKNLHSKGSCSTLFKQSPLPSSFEKSYLPDYYENDKRVDSIESSENHFCRRNE